MKNCSTPLSPTSATHHEKQAFDHAGPRKDTLEMIRRFARIYMAVPSVPAPLNGIVAN